MTIHLPVPQRSLFLHPQTTRLVAVGAALLFLLAIVSTILLIRYLADSASLREGLNRSYEVRFQSQSIMALLDQASLIKGSGDFREEGFRPERLQEAIRNAGFELGKIEKALAGSALPKGQVLDLMSALRVKMAQVDELHLETPGNMPDTQMIESEMRQRRAQRYETIIGEVRATIEKINEMEIGAIARQIADDRNRTYWGQVFVVAILGGIMLGVLVAATLVMLVLPDMATPAARR